MQRDSPNAAIQCDAVVPTGIPPLTEKPVAPHLAQSRIAEAR